MVDKAVLEIHKGHQENTVIMWLALVKKALCTTKVQSTKALQPQHMQLYPNYTMYREEAWLRGICLNAEGLQVQFIPN